MKKILFISAICLSAAACSNNAKIEAEEAHKRDSIDNIQVDANQRFVDSLEKAEEEAKMNQPKDSAGHEGHNHEGHDHEGHDHEGHKH
jgi:hypothetical protein